MNTCRIARVVLATSTFLVFSAINFVRSEQLPLSISGVYPHLTMRNDERECGTGAVVPWQGSLWAITYAPHMPGGSSDKLYEVMTDLTQRIFERSVGGTPANRMIHRESSQLLIGPYLIDSRSLILSLLEDGHWHYYRLPKGSHSYDGSHGWKLGKPRGVGGPWKDTRVFPRVSAPIGSGSAAPRPPRLPPN